MILSIDGIEYNLDVEYTYMPAVSARVAHGEEMEQAEPAYVEISSIKVETKRDEWQEIILPDQLIKDIENHIMESYE